MSITNFINSLKQPKFSLSTAAADRLRAQKAPLGNSQNSSALTASMGPSTASPAATSPKPTAVSTPQKSPALTTPAAQQYMSSLGSPAAPVVAGSTATTPQASPIATTPPPTKQPDPYTTAKNDYSTAYKDYISSLAPSAETLAAKSKYNDFVASAQSGIKAMEGQGRGIPLGLVRGQQAKLADQAEIEAQRLQGDVDIASQADKSLQAGKLAGVTMQEKLLGFTKDENEPIEVGGILYKKDADGNYKALTTKPGEGFTLGAGQSRYDSEGNLIAGGALGSTGTYVPGTDPTVDAWVKGIRSGLYKPTDVPAEFQNSVAQALSQAGKEVSETTNSIVSLIDQLLERDTGNITGIPSIGSILPGTEAQRTKNIYNQLKGMLSLENRTKLKGSGAISDFEAKTLEKAASSLGRNLSDADFISELQKLKAELAGGQTSTNVTTDEEQFLRSKGYTPEQIDAYKKKSFNKVGNTTVSIPSSSRLAYVNNNPGNLRFAGQTGATKGEGGFAKFATPQAGVEALQNQIILDASRGLTLGQFISKYAPPSENDTAQYISQIMNMIGKPTNTPLINIDLNKLTQAIAQKESSTKIG